MASVAGQSDDAPPDGSYDPIRNVRRLNLGQNRASLEASLVSWHEGFHAFLNSSTTFGNAMIFAGALAAAKGEAYAALVETMIDHVVLTHETYATVNSLTAVSQGPIDMALLERYPTYHRYVEPFLAQFPYRAYPRVSAMILSSCARAAMQTGIYDVLLNTDCAAWPEIAFNVHDSPDARFSALLEPHAVTRILDVSLRQFSDAVEASHQKFPSGMGPAEEAAFLADAGNDSLNAISHAAFSECRNLLAEIGLEAGLFDCQKQRIIEVVEKIRDFAGGLMDTQFQVPETEAEDETVFLQDFRREVLLTANLPLAAAAADLTTHPPATLKDFLLSADGKNHIQVIAMPVAKARALYKFAEGKDLIANYSGTVLTAMRRRWAPPGLDPQVELFLLDEALATALSNGLRETEIYICCAQSAFFDRAWRRRWLRQDWRPGLRVLVEVDLDPFVLLSQLARRGAVSLYFLQARVDPSSDAATEVLCFTTERNPDVLYILPCSGPFRRAMVEYSTRTFPHVDISSAFIAGWSEPLRRIVGHIFVEQGCFGNRFWE